jgi:hypothetical protein
MRRVLLALLMVAVGMPALAGTIHFDEDGISPANSHYYPLSDEYAHMGVQFLPVYGVAVWSGLTADPPDPGLWELDGTNGTNFLGFRASGLTLTMLLDEAVEGFRLDVARAAGSSAGAHVVLSGFHNGEWVEDVYLELGAFGINEWSTPEFLQPVDEVQVVGTGEGFQPFGVDNIQWGGDGGGPGVLEVDVSVRPGNSNKVNPFSNSTVPVVLYGSDTFHVMNVDETTLVFASPLADFGAGSEGTSLTDVNDDGYDDLLSHHRVPGTGIAVGDTEACLWGDTLDGDPFEGCAPVDTKSQFVNSSKKPKKH